MMLRSVILLSAVLLYAVAPVRVQAQTAPAAAPSMESLSNPNSDEPLEITADETLEWHRNDLRFIAHGNVNTTQGDVTITAATQTADYRETKESGFDIYKLTADKNVRIISRGNIAEGDLAIYEVDKGLATMTGDNLKLTSPERVLTANERFEYYVTDGRLNAVGNAIVVQGTDKIRADQMSAILKQDTASGKRSIDKLTANGNVIITTATEVLKGQRGEYDAGTNTAKIIGNVTITRGPNILSGAQAEVNLTTNVSKMIGGGTDDKPGRVSGRFYPSSEDSNKKEAAPQPVIQTPAPTQQPTTPLQPPQTQPKGLMTRP